MEGVFIYEKTFTNLDVRETSLKQGGYEDCKFKNCDFTNVDFSGFVFADCEFKGCNLSLIKMNQTTFQNVDFKDCKMLGLHFENCNEYCLSFTFESCILNDSSFFKRKIRQTIFRNTQLQDVDFTESDLSNALFADCDFLRATFDRTNLERADLRTSINYSIDPEKNRIKKAKFSLVGISGLLDKYDIEIS